MLGAGLGLHGGVKLKSVIYDYTFDFSSSGDSIIARSGSDGDITIELGQNPPGESTDDWLKATYGEDAIHTNAGATGLVFSIGTAAPGQGYGGIGFESSVDNGKIGDAVSFSYKLYLDGDWDGGDDINRWAHMFGAYNVGDIHTPNTGSQSNLNLSQDEIISIEVKHPRGDEGFGPVNGWAINYWYQRIQIIPGSHANVDPFGIDWPNEGAEIYIKDFNIKVWR